MAAYRWVDDLNPVHTSKNVDVSLSAIAHMPFPAHDSGTVYLMMSSLPHRSQHFVEN